MRRRPKSLHIDDDRRARSKGWRLVWADEFDGPTIDASSWSRCPVGNADWMRHMSPLDSLCRVENGTFAALRRMPPRRSRRPTPLPDGRSAEQRQAVDTPRTRRRARPLRLRSRILARDMAHARPRHAVALGRRDRHHGAFEPRHDSLSNRALAPHARTSRARGAQQLVGRDRQQRLQRLLGGSDAIRHRVFT